MSFLSVLAGLGILIVVVYIFINVMRKPEVPELTQQEQNRSNVHVIFNIIKLDPNSSTFEFDLMDLVNDLSPDVRTYVKERFRLTPDIPYSETKKNLVSLITSKLQTDYESK